MTAKVLNIAKEVAALERMTAEECPRIPAAFLAEERRSLGDRWYRQEYCCDFVETIDAVFSHDDIQRARSSDIEPLFPITTSAT